MWYSELTAFSIWIFCRTIGAGLSDTTVYRAGLLLVDLDVFGVHDPMILLICCVRVLWLCS